MRCKCCDKPLNENELLAVHPVTKEPEDMCRRCLNSVYPPESFEDDVEDLWTFGLGTLDKTKKLW